MFSTLISGTALLAAGMTVNSPLVGQRANPAAEILSESGTRPETVGLWESEESGWILEITPDGIRRWQKTEASCYPSMPNGPTFMGQIEYRYFTLLSPDQASFAYLPSDGHAIFHRIERLPETCTETPETSHSAVFETFKAIFDQHYSHFDRREVSWARQVERAREQLDDAMSEAELFELLASMIEPLGDSHTKLFAEIDGERRRAQFGLGETLPRIEATIGETPWLIGILQQLFTEILDPGAQHIAKDRVVAGTIDNRVGYLQFFTMGGFTTGHTPGTPEWAAAELSALDEILDEAFAGAARLDAYILDLTNNRGGYDAVCRSIASRFSDTRFTGYSVRSEEAGLMLADYEITPHDGPRFAGPVYILVSDVTVSCGEITTLMLRQLPNVRVAGSTTRGAFSTPLAKPLLNGWYLELSNEIFADADGETFEGRGIAPDIEIHPFPEDAPIEGHARAIEAVLADLER